MIQTENKSMLDTISTALHLSVDSLADGELKGTDIYQFMKMVMIMNETFRRKSSNKLQSLCDQLLLDLKGFMAKFDPDKEEPFLVTEELFDRLERLVGSFDKVVDSGVLSNMDILHICERVTNYLTIGEAKRRGMNTDEVVVSSTMPKRSTLSMSVQDIMAQDISVAKAK